MGFVCALLAHDLRSAIRAGGDARAARDNRGWPGWKTFGLILAAMICARTCAMAFNRIVTANLTRLNRALRNAFAQRRNFMGERNFTLYFVGGGLICSQFYFSESALLLFRPSRSQWPVFYSLTKRFTDYTHRFSWHRAHARRPSARGWRCAARTFRFGNFANDHARLRSNFVARRLRHHLRATRL